LDPDKRRALSDFYREEFLRYIEYFKANGILSDDSEDAMQQTCSKLMADLDQVCSQANFPAVAETLLQKFDILTRLSELDPRQGH
jgi:DNA-directed RNA polymerase specialized sigma24 family protein